MNMFKNLYKICAAALLALGFLGCQHEELVKPNALLTESSLTFRAVGAEPQQLMVASDDAWVIDAPEWITVDPASGTNTVNVTVSVEDNATNGVIDLPREGKIVIMADNGSKYTVETVVYQKGDKYPEASYYSKLADIAPLEDNTVVKLDAEPQVAAISAKGAVITDGTDFMYLEGATSVAVGDKLYTNGIKQVANGFAVVVADEVDVLSNEEYVYPEAKNITATVDSYRSEKMEYVTIAGTVYDNTLINISGSNATVNLLNVHPSFGLDKVNYNKAVIKGFYAGVADGQINIIVTSIKAEGRDDTVKAYLFSDNFNWLQPFIDAYGSEKVSDCVADQEDSADGAINIYSTLVSNGIFVLDELRARGYTDLNPDMKTIYLQQGYLKYGATDKQSGLILPVIPVNGTADLLVSFQWCCHLSGARNVDDVKMVVQIDGPGYVVTASGAKDAKMSDEFISTQKKDQMFWQDAIVRIAEATKDTRIAIHPNPIGTSDAKVEGVHRFYLDNIIVDYAPAFLDANIVVSELENDLVTFEGTPEAPVSFKVNSDFDYTLSTVGGDWFTIDVTEGAANVEQVVTVTCQPSELSTLRKGSIQIKSGDNTKVVSVVQSAAGQELDPYIALSTGNNITVLGEGEEFSAKVQTNTTYEVEASDWIEVVATPATKAKTEWFEHKFIAKVNMTGAKRTGYVRFANKDLGIESVLNVEQENFVPRIDVIPAMPFRALSGKGGSMTFALDANIPYSVSTDASWITLPANQGPSGQIAVPIAFGANDAAAERTANIIFTNPTYEYTKTLKVIQSPAGIILQDDFDWVKPFNEAGGNTAGDTIGSGGSSSDAPNVYTASGYGEAFLKAFAAMGYVDLCPGEKVLYAQDAYLKFGRTNGHNNALEINVPFMKTTDATIDFDFAAMVQGSGKVDDSDLTLVIVGEGTFENGTKYSDELKIVQENGAYDWTHASAKILGANENTKIRIVMTRILGKSSDGTFDGTYNYNVSGAGRWFLDNLVIK